MLNYLAWRRLVRKSWGRTKMKDREVCREKAFLFGLVGILLQTQVYADSTRLSVGAYLSSGDYGTTSDTEMQSYSLSLRRKTGRWTFKASTSYLRVDGEATVLPDCESTGVTGDRKTRSGIGDLNLSVSNLVYYDAAEKLGLTVRGKVKVPTADEDKFLGTGEFDYTVELAPFVKKESNTFFGAIGYKVYGDTATTNYRNVWLLKAGLMHQLNPKHALGVVGNYRQKTTATRDDKASLMGFHTMKLDKDLRLQSYLIAGFTDSTADFAGGASLMYDF